MPGVSTHLIKITSFILILIVGTVKVDARGTGYAILQMHVQYNVDIEKFQTQPPVKAFDLVTKQFFYGRNQSHITYVSCQR